MKPIIVRAMAGAMLATSILGCTSGGGSGPTPSPPPTRCEDGTIECGAPIGNGIQIVNRTEADVAFVERDTPPLTIDRGVIDGSYPLPIPLEAVGAVRPETLRPGSNATLESNVDILPRLANAKSFGGVFRIGEGPWLFATGVGRISVRHGNDGALTAVADDPRAVIVMPAQRPVVPCAEGELEAPFDDPPPEFWSSSSSWSHRPLRITTITRDERGCRHLSVENADFEQLAVMRACIPDAAFPFSAFDAALAATITSDAMRLESGTGNALELRRVGFLADTARPDTDGTVLSRKVDARCMRVDPSCGHVDVPITLRVGREAGLDHDATPSVPVVIGEPLPNGTDTHAVWVLAAAARPIANAGCTTPDAMARRDHRATAWLAIVDRVAP